MTQSLLSAANNTFQLPALPGSNKASQQLPLQWAQPEASSDTPQAEGALQSYTCLFALHASNAAPDDVPLLVRGYSLV